MHKAFKYDGVKSREGSLVLQGLYNWFNQVYLLLYKNATEFIRKPWVPLLLILFPSLLLGVVYGIETSILSTRGVSQVKDNAPFEKCKPYPGFKDCMTIAYTLPPTWSSEFTNNVAWSSLQAISRQYGLTISSQMRDMDKKYDMNYFSSEREMATWMASFSNAYVKYFVTFKTSNSDDWSNNNQSFRVQAGGPRPAGTRGFGFADSIATYESTGIYDWKNVLASAIVGTVHGMTNGVPLDQIEMEDFKVRSYTASAAVVSDSDVPRMIYLISGPIALWISVFATQLYMTSKILEDRSKKLKIGMFMMGLHAGSYQTSFFLFYGLFSIFPCLITLGIGRACGFYMFTHVNLFITFMLYWLSYLASIGFTLLLTAAVHHATASIVLSFISGLVALGLSISAAMLNYLLWAYSFSQLVWFFNYPFSMGIIFYACYLILSTGDPPATFVKFSDLYDSSYIGFAGPTMSTALGTLAFCGFLGWILSIWIETVFPREVGPRRNPFFFFLPSYWGLTSESEMTVETFAYRANKMSDVAVETDPDLLVEANNVLNRLNNKDPTLALAIVKLCKTYQKNRFASDQDVRAVDFITLGADEGSVLGIVGHNGAGKTTLMSILCGIAAPSSGDGRIFGHSISANMSPIHEIMGVCPQENVLWPDLTTYEHLKLFAILKRIPRKYHEEVIYDSLVQVDLLNVKDRHAGKLSGGMKRRLSLAIALIGNPKIIILDEPTSGLDPRNRIEVWDIINRIKVGRVILLTTHSMAEASKLSDKIAVMAAGRLRALGTPSHLIQRYGKGHEISIIAKMGKVADVKAEIEQLMPHALLEIDSGTKLTYNLPMHRSEEIPPFCKFMESSGSVDLIEDWGLTPTSFEQVFLRLTHGGGNLEGTTSANSLQLNVAVDDEKQSILGMINITVQTTLDEARQLMKYIPGLPPSFTFIINGAPIAPKQEGMIAANLALPVVLIRPSEPEAPSTVGHIPRSLSPSVANLEVLRRQKADLERRIAEMEAALGIGSASSSNQDIFM